MAPFSVVICLPELGPNHAVQTSFENTIASD